eukprot:2664572-Pyramimonas_sp.AAC.2
MIRQLYEVMLIGVVAGALAHMEVVMLPTLAFASWSFSRRPLQTVHDKRFPCARRVFDFAELGLCQGEGDANVHRPQGAGHVPSVRQRQGAPHAGRQLYARHWEEVKGRGAAATLTKRPHPPPN